MFRLSTFLCTAIILSFLALDSSAQQDKKRLLDAYGDPLPEGAVARLGTLKWRQEVDASLAVFSPDGKKIASATGALLEGPYLYLWNQNGTRLWRNLTTDQPQIISVTVTSLVFSPDGSKVVVGFGKAAKPIAQLVMFDTETGKVKTVWKEQDRPVVAAAFADHGKLLVSIDDTGKVRAWDVTTQQVVHEWQAVESKNKSDVGAKGTPRSIESAVFAPAGDKFAILVANLEKDQKKWELQVLDTLQRQSILQVEMDVAASTKGGIFEKWPAKAMEGKMVFSADGNTLALGVAKGIAFLDAKTGKIEAEFRTPQPFGLSFSGDGKSFVLIYPEQICIHDAATRKLIREVRVTWPSRPKVSSLSPDGVSLLTDEVSATNLRCIELLDTTTGKFPLASSAPTYPISSLRFSADGNSLYAGAILTTTSHLFTWERKNWRLVNSISGFEATKNMPGDGSRLAVGSADFSYVLLNDRERGIEIRERATGKVLSTFEKLPVQKEKGYVITLVGPNSYFSPTNRFVVIPNYPVGRVVFDARTGKPWRHINVQGPIDNWRIAFSPDDKRMAVAESSGEIVVYDTDADKVEFKLGQAVMAILSGALAFSPDGNYLAAWGNDDGMIRIWNIRTRKRIHELPGKPADRKVVSLDLDREFALAFSPDGRLLASTHRQDKSIIQIWEMSTGKLRHELKGHIGRVTALAWTPDGRLLASGSLDATVLIWDLWGIVGQK